MKSLPSVHKAGLEFELIKKVASTQFFIINFYLRAL